MAKVKVKKLRVFDFDDTLVKSNSEVYVTNNGKTKTLTPGEFAIYKLKSGDVFDFSDFDKVIEPKQIKAMFKVFRNIYRASGSRRLTILTARAVYEPVRQFFNAKNNITIMGTRHGEKKHEVLLNREELFKSKDLGRYYKVPIDKRTLNYEIYFEKGDKPLSDETEYTSENTKRLDKGELIKLLLKLDYVKSELHG